jgi:hypothetical protein
MYGGEWMKDPNRDSTGKFRKGHTVNQVTPEVKCLRAATKDEIIRVVHSLTLPHESLAFEMKDGNPNTTRLQYFFNRKLVGGDSTFIKGMIDKVFPTPKAPAETEDQKEETPDYSDESRLIAMVMKAREEKIQKDLDQKKVYDV